VFGLAYCEFFFSLEFFFLLLVVLFFPPHLYHLFTGFTPFSYCNVFFLISKEGYLLSFNPFAMTHGEMRKGGLNHLEGSKKFGAPTLVFFGPHHKFLEFIFLGSKFSVLLQFALLF
jgi:hypothetical protein